MQIKEITFNRFDGGKAFEKRDTLANQFSKSLNFDIHASPAVLTPVRDYEADEGYNGSSTGIRASDIAAFGMIGSTIYGIGRKNDGTGRKIYQKAISSSTWLPYTASDGSAVEAADGSAVPGFFIRNFTTNGSSLNWFVTGSASTPTTGFWMIGLVDFSTSSPASFSKKTLGFNPTFNPQAILGKDGVVYVSDNNKLHGCETDGTVSSSVFTVSVNYKITSLALWGNYLAIAIYGQGNSKVLLWDYNNPQSSETIEWGEGALMVLDNLNGVLVGITDKYINSTLFGAAANGSGSMQIKEWNGGFGEIKEVQATGVTAGAIQQFKYVKNGVLSWYAKIPISDTENEEGIWTYGKRVSTQPNAISLERQVPGTFEGFWGAGDHLYFPHSEDGHVSRTSDTATYTLTSSYETALVNDGDTSTEKNVLGLSLSFTPLESGQSLVLQYRKDGGSWTTTDPVPVMATGDLSAIYPLSTNFKEIEFRVESTGGAKPTALKLRYEVLSNPLA